ncbi:CYTH and CHAD domain-containing protein [Streptomyces sp. KR80]|uniref:CYTH and CHAD domain-containing protein n=1 Tax=Streptomyces sp. KR80 TaxID=3457426 RepID=UPI003FD0EAAE
MADEVREIERKYESTADGLPDLTGVPGVAAVVDEGVTDLDATYYDTAGVGTPPAGGWERLAADGITLRRRTGGDDAGWHLKLPVATDVREEIRAPLSDGLPEQLAALVRSRVRRAPLVPVVRLRSRRDVRRLVDADGAPLAEVSVDDVVAERLAGGDGTARWTEIEVELAEGADRGFLDAVEETLGKAGVRRAAGPSKLARALAETRPRAEGQDEQARLGPVGAAVGEPSGKGPTKEVPGKKSGKRAGKKLGKTPGKSAEPSAGDHLLRHLRAQVTAIVELDPAVRRDQPDSVHRMRVATRRLRSAFRSFRKLLDREVTDPISDELKWLAGELGVERDREVLTARLYERRAELPGTLLVGPVDARLRTWSDAQRSGAHDRVAAVLDDGRYLDLLDALDALLAGPPLLPAAARAPLEVLPDAVVRDFDRLAAAMDTALAATEGGERDVAMHEARKAAKRTRYSAETAQPAIGKPAKRFVQHMKALQDALGDHQDSVVARGALRDIAAQAEAAEESSFTYGVLYGREEARAARRERELPQAWKEASRKGLRTALGA